MYKSLSKSICFLAIAFLAGCGQMEKESISFEPITLPGTRDSQD